MDIQKQYISLINQGLSVWSLDNEMSLRYRISNMLIPENWKLILDDYNDNQGVWQNHNNIWHEFIYLLLNKFGQNEFKAKLIEISKIEPSSENANIRSSILTMMLRNIVNRDIMGDEIKEYCEKYNMYYIIDAVIYNLIMSLDNLYVYLHLLKGIKYDEFKSQISSSTIFKNSKVPKIIRLKKIMSENMKDFMYSDHLTAFFIGQDVEEHFIKLFPKLCQPNFNLLTFIDLFKIFALEFVSDSNTPLNPIGWIKNKEKNVDLRRKSLSNLGKNNVVKVGPYLEGLGSQWIFENKTANIRNEKSSIPNKDKFEHILEKWLKVKKILNFEEPTNEKNIVLYPLRDFLNKCKVDNDRLFYFINSIIQVQSSYMRIFIVWLFLRDNGYDISGNCMNSGQCPEENLKFETIMGHPGTLMTPLYYIWSILVGQQRNYLFDENDNVIYKTKAELKAEYEESKPKKDKSKKPKPKPEKRKRNNQEITENSEEDIIKRKPNPKRNLKNYVKPPKNKQSKKKVERAYEKAEKAKKPTPTEEHINNNSQK
jgi:hypothetical protein